MKAVQMLMLLAVFVAILSSAFFFSACSTLPTKPTGVSVDAVEGGIEACITLARKQGCACPPAPDSGIVGR